MIEIILNNNEQLMHTIYHQFKYKYPSKRSIDQYEDFKHHIYLEVLIWWDKKKDYYLDLPIKIGSYQADKYVKGIIWKQINSSESSWYRRYTRPSRYSNLEDISPPFEVEHDDITDEIKQKFKQCISGEPFLEKQWLIAIFWFRYIEGRKIKDISENLLASESFIKKKCYKIKKLINGNK